ncbi:PTS sugar transporter subunit IIB [Psychrilyobacter atlanticus]|uniref:PTS sugar transporter subunit IIB n=1 Tax=Psychrilyobacter atlanticus TaxID=271091 RepID=UPI0003FCC8F3|nr:PTS sugar transporter subunit IIB [Psychrilyobacter atlanticus]
MKKILLLCSAGMSTSIVVKKMREAAELKGIECEIEAMGLEQFHLNLDEYDVFLLGPQVRFKKDELNKIANEVNKTVEVINSMDYGMMKGEKILDFALELIGK